MTKSITRSAWKTLTACAVAAAIPAAAHAQAPTGLNVDEWTLSLGTDQLFFHQTNGADITRFGGDARLGYMIAENVRITGLAGYQYEDNATTTHDLRLRGQGTYHFLLPDMDQFVPYVGGGAGLAYVDADVDDDWGFSFHGTLGGEFFPQMADNVSFFAEYRPEWVWFDDFDDTFTNTIALGISYQW